MSLAFQHTREPIALPPGSPLVVLLEWALYPCVLWLFLVGLWSGPALGATLAYPNGLLAVDLILAVVLALLALHGRVAPLRSYPFLWPCLGVLAVVALAALARMVVRGQAYEALRLWQYAEPMLRGLLIYLAVAGRPPLWRYACGAALAGLGVLAGACIVQHLTGVTRWYVNLSLGWESGIQAMRDVVPNRVQGLTSYINLTAALLAAAVPIWVTPLALRPLGWGRRVLLGAGVLATVAALWYTNSRGPLLAALVVGCLVVWSLSPRWRWGAVLAVATFIALSKAPDPIAAPLSLVALGVGAVLLLIAWRRRVVLLLPLALTLAIVGGIQSVDAYVLHQPLGLRVADQGVVDGARMALYRDVAVHTAASPCWGVGDHALAMWILTSPETARYGLDKLPRTQWNAHNQVLQWAGAEGIPVALAFTVLVVGAVWWLWRQAVRWQTPQHRVMGLGIAAGLAIFLLTNLAEAHFWRIEGGGFFWSLLALATSCYLAEAHNTPMSEDGDAA